MDESNKRATPEFPAHCRVCQANLHCLPYLNNPNAFEDEQGRHCKIIGYDIFDGKPRTFEYDVVCAADPKHTALKVVETPSVGFRCVIRADRYDDSRVRK